MLWLWVPARAALGRDDGMSFYRRHLFSRWLLGNGFLRWDLRFLARRLLGRCRLGPWALAERRALRGRQCRPRPAGQLLLVVEQPRRQFPVRIDGDDLRGRSLLILKRFRSFRLELRNGFFV